MQERERIVRSVNSLFNRVSKHACHDLKLRPCAHAEIGETIERIGRRELLKHLDAERNNLFVKVGMHEGERDQIREFVQAHYDDCTYCKAMEVRWCMQHVILDDIETENTVKDGHFRQPDVRPTKRNSREAVAVLPWLSATRLLGESLLAMSVVFLLVLAILHYHQFVNFETMSNPLAAISAWLGGDANVPQIGLCVKAAGQSEAKTYRLVVENAKWKPATQDAQLAAQGTQALEQFIETLGQAEDAKSHEYMVISTKGDVFFSETVKPPKKRAAALNLALDEQKKVGTFYPKPIFVAAAPTARKRGAKAFLNRQAEELNTMLGKKPNP
jgi:hypothetical protein